MKDFKNVPRFEVELMHEAAIYLDGLGEFILYDDYKELLDAYLELKHRMDGLDK